MFGILSFYFYFLLNKSDNRFQCLLANSICLINILNKLELSIDRVCTKFNRLI
jgi:hypothetical protein